jgi:hypothetical protein
MPKVMDIAEILAQGGYRFVVVCAWPKENPDPEDEVHQDKRVKDKMANLVIRQPQEVQHTFTFNLSGERTLLISGYTLKPKDLYKFVKEIQGEDGSEKSKPTHISVKLTPGKDPTPTNMVLGVGLPFQGDISPEPDGHRFVAKLYWDPKDDEAARNRITDIVTKAQNGEVDGIDKVMQCDILVGEQAAWIVGFAHKGSRKPYQHSPENLQRFISKIVYQGVIDARVSHATTGPQVNTILNNIRAKK